MYIEQGNSIAWYDHLYWNWLWLRLELMWVPYHIRASEWIDAWRCRASIALLKCKWNKDNQILCSRRPRSHPHFNILLSLEYLQQVLNAYSKRQRNARNWQTSPFLACLEQRLYSLILKILRLLLYKL